MPHWYNDSAQNAKKFVEAAAISASATTPASSSKAEAALQCPPCDDATSSPDTTSRFHQEAGLQLTNPTVQYHQILPNVAAATLVAIAQKTPKPKGHTKFSTIEVVHQGGPLVERLANSPWFDHEVPVRFHELPETGGDPSREYNAIFEIETRMMLAKANRQSLVIWAGNPDKPELDGFAGFLGMLPFRGISVALVTFSQQYPDPFRYATPSGVLEHDSYDAGRMGLSPVKAVFGALPSRAFTAELKPWDPIVVEPAEGEPMLRLPFRIAGLSLPMITYTGKYDHGISELAERVVGYYAARHQGAAGSQAAVFPVISCGQTVDGLGYGADLLDALTARGCPGYYFTHRSGETYKRYSEYAPSELLEQVAVAKRAGKTVLFIAVGGGCNGNATGVVAAMTNSHFIEVPTTPLHFNDATTSAKKAFSLIVDDKILSKNLLGTFYLPRLVFCINETFFTCNTASIHSAVGESTKTMNMIGVAPSAPGQRDYHNILGAHEFASDTTAILSTVCGFERLVEFIGDAATRDTKHAALEAGAAVKKLRAELAEAIASGAPAASVDRCRQQLKAASAARCARVGAIRGRYYALPGHAREAISEFFTVINAEIVKAKAMFLAYEDPFEKYRALLFEYAHTLGHAVEAWLAGVHMRAAEAGIDSEAAVRNHGQCVGMAVIWAGEMSRRLGALTGDGYTCHQAMVYLFNSFGGFSFGPVRALADALGITKADFLREVLGGVRLDNKRGYVECADCTKSVDQLVTRRPGQMLRSDDSNAEVRYLVLVEESWQQAVLESAFDLEFDNVAHLDSATGKVVFAPLASCPRAPAQSAEVAHALRSRIYALYGDDESMPSTPAELAEPSAGGGLGAMRRTQSESAQLSSHYYDAERSLAGLNTTPAERSPRSKMAQVAEHGSAAAAAAAAASAKAADSTESSNESTEESESSSSNESMEECMTPMTPEPRPKAVDITDGASTTSCASSLSSSSCASSSSSPSSVSFASSAVATASAATSAPASAAAASSSASSAASSSAASTPMLASPSRLSGSLVGGGAGGGANGAGGMRRACSEAVALDTLHKKKQRAALSRSDVQKMRDFSHVLDAEFRDGYRKWREGKPRFPKGDINKPPAHAVTLVYREDGLKTTWELQLAGLPRLSPTTRFPYQSGYARWNMALRTQPSQASAAFAARGA